MKINDLAPDSDTVVLTTPDGERNITISRDIENRVWVVIEDTIEGSQTSIILGETGETQRL